MNAATQARVGRALRNAGLIWVIAAFAWPVGYLAAWLWYSLPPATKETTMAQDEATASRIIYAQCTEDAAVNLHLYRSRGAGATQYCLELHTEDEELVISELVDRDVALGHIEELQRLLAEAREVLRREPEPEPDAEDPDAPDDDEQPEDDDD